LLAVLLRWHRDRPRGPSWSPPIWRSVATIPRILT